MSRWAQLTYSSFDRHDGRGGGWQVKDVTGDIPEADRQLLCGRVATQVDAGVEMPRFPTPAQVAELPHQMVHAPLTLSGGPALVTWHTAPAGFDASGRPGNVFAHVVVDHEPGADADAIRPIERWRSPDWLIPFGPEAVLAASLSASIPGPGHVDRRTVASWLFAPRQWRTNTLAAILDALAGHREGARPLVLAVEDVDEAANWIAAVSLCTSIGAARQIAFSTLERASSLRHAIGYGLEIMCVPRVDMPALAKLEDVVVIDTAENVEVADLGGDHRTPRGDAIVATPWSAMILELFADPETMVERVDQLDAAAASVGDQDLHPAWPAAVVVSRDSQGDLAHEAMTLVTRHAPEGLRDSDLYEDVVGGMDADAGSTAEAWEHVVVQGAHDDEPERNRVLAEAAVATYATRALDDEAWLAQPGPARLPAGHLRPATFSEQWVGALTKQLHSDDPVVVVHAVELGLRLGAEQDAMLNALMNDVLQTHVVPVLVDPRAGAALAQRLESVAFEARYLLWTLMKSSPVVRQVSRPPGALVAPEVTTLLGPAPDEPDPLEGVDPATRPPGPGQLAIDPLLAELAFRMSESERVSEESRFAAAWAQLERGGVGPDGQPLDPWQISPFVDPPFAAHRMLAMVRRFGRAIPPAWHLPHLLTAPGEATWRQVWQEIIGQAELQVAHLASVRLEKDQPLGAPQLVTGQAGALAWAASQHAVTDPDLFHRAHLVLAAALLQGVDLSVPSGFDQPDAFSASEVEMLGQWGPGAIRPARLIEVFARRAQGSPLVEPQAGPGDGPGHQRSGDVVTWLFGLRAAGRGEPVPLVAALLLDRAAQRGSDTVLAAVREIPGLAEREARALERWLGGWLRHERRREGW